MAFDDTKPNLAQMMGDVIESTQENFEAVGDHMDDTTTAHGLAAILTSKTDYETHKANTSTAHGIDVINSRAVAAQAEITAARGSKTSLTGRLDVALQQDGNVKLTSLAAVWIDNGDTPSYISNLSFSVTGDRTKVYLAGCIIRATCSGSYVYGIVQSASYGSSITTVTFSSGYPVLTSPMTKAEIALLAFNNAVEAAVAQNSADIVTLQSQVAAQAVNQYVSTDDQPLFHDDNLVTLQ